MMLRYLHSVSAFIRAHKLDTRALELAHHVRVHLEIVRLQNGNESWFLDMAWIMSYMGHVISPHTDADGVHPCNLHYHSC